MVKVTLIDADKVPQELEGKAGMSLMEVAKAKDVRGIDADCGGNAACGTCAISLSGDWVHLLEGRSDEEADMLEFSVEEPEKCRLACQILLTDQMDGVIATVETERD